MPTEPVTLNAAGQPLSWPMIAWIVAQLQANGSVSVYGVSTQPGAQLLPSAEKIAEVLCG